MTQQEWLVCTEPTPLLEFLQGKASDRKLRLFCVASCRLIWHLMSEANWRQGVEMAEQYADKVGSKRKMAELARIIENTEITRTQHLPAYNGEFLPSHAVEAALRPDASFGSMLSSSVIKVVADRAIQQAKLLHDIFSNPFHPTTHDPAWQTPTVLALATAAYDDRIMPAGTLDTARLAVLADALEEAGCDNADILNHCRQPGVHVRGCWVVDLILGKE
jgi:hypothetical protein